VSGKRNHGGITKKPEEKERARTNMEELIAVDIGGSSQGTRGIARVGEQDGGNGRQSVCQD